MPRDRKVTDAGRSVSQLKVTLVSSQPAIWRRVQVESTVTLQRLHRILQVVMGVPTRRRLVSATCFVNPRTG